MEVFGPYSVEEAREYLSTGRLSLSDFAQLPGTMEWIPLGSVPGVRSAPPPPIFTQPADSATESHQQVSKPAATAQPAGTQDQTRPSGVRVGLVLRDVAMIFVLTAMGGGVAGVAAGGGDPASSPSFLVAAAISNFFFGTLGFIISGCLATGNRWRHLAWVAFGVWIASIINVWFFGVTVEQWMMTAFFTAFLMAVGGGLSFLFKRS